MRRIAYLIMAGGAEGNRTPDLCSAIAALSHLSYSPAPCLEPSDGADGGPRGAQIATRPRQRNAGMSPSPGQSAWRSWTALTIWMAPNRIERRLMLPPQ